MKKFVCFALVFTILINVIGFGFMNVNASAEAVAATVAIFKSKSCGV